MPKDMKIYVAGHRGLTGSAMLRLLTVKGYTNVITRTRDELDLLDAHAVRNFFGKEKPECVIVCAARVGGIKANMTYPADFLYENLEVQNNIIWNAHLHAVKKLVFLSSSCVYPREAPQPMKEEYMMSGKHEPTNEGYAIAKIAGMGLCRMLNKQYGDNFFSVIPTNLYGPNDHFEDERGHVIPALMGRMHEAKMSNAPKLEVWGTGKPRREFLYVDDFAEAIFFLLSSYTVVDAINVGLGEDVSVADLASIMRDVVGYQGSIIFNPEKPDGMPRKLLDVTQLNAAGWRHKVELKEGLEKTYKWFLANKATV